MLGTRVRIIVVIKNFSSKTGEFDIFNDISDRVALVQLIESCVNVNHAVSIHVYWIYDSNYKRKLTFIKGYLYIIFLLIEMRSGFMLNLKMFTIPSGK